MKQRCLSKFLLLHPVCQLNCLRTSNKLSLGSWYVANVSTFPKTLLLFCLWLLMNLFGTNPNWRCFQQNCIWCLSFVQGSEVREKFQENYSMDFLRRIKLGSGRPRGGATPGAGAGPSRGWALDRGRRPHLPLGPPLATPLSLIRTLST